MIDNDKAVVLVFTASFVAEIDGSHARAASLLNRLSSEFSNVIVYSYRNHATYPWTEESFAMFRHRWPNVHLVVEEFSFVLARFAAVKNILMSMFPALSSIFLRLHLNRQAGNFERIKNDAGVFIVSYKFALSELNGVESSKCIVDTHDLLFAKWTKLNNKRILSLNSLRKFRGELGALDSTSGVVAISPSEASFFRIMLEKTRTFYVSSWENISGTSSNEITDNYKYDLVFVASKYEMNVRGFISLLRNHGEWLSRYRIAICGQICEDNRIVEASSNFPLIRLLGFVADIDEIYSASKAALAPVDGTGLKMKIVSALQHGLPCFVSDQAFEGLPHGYDGAIFGIDEHTVRQVVDHPQSLAAAREKSVAYYSKFNEISESDRVIDLVKSMLKLT